MFDLAQRVTKNKIQDFVQFILSTSRKVGFKVSSRGWGYILEQEGLITKDQFDKVESLINKCRKEGLLPVDFVAEDGARLFHEIHTPETRGMNKFLVDFLDYLDYCEDYYTPNWWDGEEYYIQMIVEKIDLVTLFQPVCRDFHIPIANARGWSSILQRADYSRRFKEAEDRGMKCVLLYCGDHDPDGLRISDTIRKNLRDVQDVCWSNGDDGYDPQDLIIDRFGLNHDFIIKNKLTWIDNLITGSGLNLANPNHPNYNMPYLQAYLKEIGERKCEANALVIAPQEGRALCRRSIEHYLGEDALDRFKSRRIAARKKVLEYKEESGIQEHIDEIKTILENQ